MIKLKLNLYILDDPATNIQPKWCEDQYQLEKLRWNKM